MQEEDICVTQYSTTLFYTRQADLLTFVNPHPVIPRLRRPPPPMRRPGFSRQRNVKEEDISITQYSLLHYTIRFSKSLKLSFRIARFRPYDRSPTRPDDLASDVNITRKRRRFEYPNTHFHIRQVGFPGLVGGRHGITRLRPWRRSDRTESATRTGSNDGKARLACTCRVLSRERASVHFHEPKVQTGHRSSSTKGRLRRNFLRQFVRLGPSHCSLLIREKAVESSSHWSVA